MDLDFETLPYEEFAKLCIDLGPFLPTNSRTPCHAYEVPGNIILLHVMLKPYFESKKLIAREDDLVVASYPRTGATLVQEICFLLQQNLNGREYSTSSDRFCLIESPKNGSTAVGDNISGPRFLKTHLPYPLLPRSVVEKGCKIIYVARNPKDTLVSYYHFFKSTSLTCYSGTMSEFLDLFLQNKVLYSSFARNVLGYWEKCNAANILFVTYEDIIKDLSGSIRSIAAFMELSITDAQVTNVAQVLCLNKSNTFECDRQSLISKESVGEWKNHFDEEMNRKMDEYIKDNLTNTGFNFEYEI